MKMPLHSIAVLLFLLILQVAFARGQQPTVEPEAGKKSRPPTGAHGSPTSRQSQKASTTCEGVDLWAM